MSRLADLRRDFHRALLGGILHPRADSRHRDSLHVWTNADSSSSLSVALAGGAGDRIARAVGVSPVHLAGRGGSSVGSEFERATRAFLADALAELRHLQGRTLRVQSAKPISAFAQYAHLEAVRAIVKQHEELRVSIGGEYIVRPDIVVAVEPIDDDLINEKATFVSDDVGYLSLQRRGSRRPQPGLSLHASISCKWTMRSDRAQNTRTEALNLIRSRKSRLPHIVAVTMEPLPSRLASIAHGTGDVDCVYHGALYELLDTAREVGGFSELLTMVDGGRLRDISDLPLDLLA
ncbi:NgoMIV family type II restriction endonuclease [Patulibacter brassicae]|uniref:NgoMIV family type II restriction endonuclease n=1 Tax=Patulibacter brassicae TaxID=1705717 RepID=A0ABU4VL43_9ACTN|nr:NgoMIV family type II restriction endonuclease [Patulibacter brassicae]MDX8152072.1 NgoMIV family type II restriction endonuclease [Patulibacter brassicae]